MDSLNGLSIEEKHLLSKFRPRTLAAAKRLQGITPVAAFELIRYSRNAEAQMAVKTQESLRSEGRPVSI